VQLDVFTILSSDIHNDYSCVHQSNRDTLLKIPVQASYADVRSDFESLFPSSEGIIEWKRFNCCILAAVGCKRWLKTQDPA
jgi:hypothetical protein